MNDFQMPSEEDKPRFVLENFEKIASKYDSFNDWNSFYLHRTWKNTMVDWLKESNPVDVMDLCCGTGDIALRISKLGSVKKLYAVDFSPNMLEVARTRLNSESDNRVSTMLGDAMNLNGWKDNSLDAITIGFGLRNVKNIRKCLQEILRVLRPGGIFLNLDVGKVKNPVIRLFADFYFFRIVPMLGYFIWGGKNSMFDYLPVSSLTYPGQDDLKIIMQDEGFSDVKYKNFAFGNVSLHIAIKSFNTKNPTNNYN